MNLTMHSIIIELSFHAWTKRSLKIEFGKNWCQNYNPKWSIFKKSVHLPAFLHNFHTYTIIYFSDPIIKISWEKLGSSRFVEFCHKRSMPSKAIQNGILSIIHAINKPNCWHEALILYLVSENELLKPNQFHCLEFPRLLPCNCSLIGLWLAQQAPWFCKTRVNVFFQNLVPIKQHKWCRPYYLGITIFSNHAWIFHWFIFSFKS